MKRNAIETPNGRAIFMRAPRRLTQSELSLALQSMEDSDPRWLAVHQIVDEELAAATLEVSDPNPKNRDHAGGRVDALATLKQRLHDERKKVVEPAKSKRRKTSS